MRFLPLACLLALFSVVNASAAATKSSGGGEKKWRAGMDIGLGLPTADNVGGSRLLLGVDFYAYVDPKIDLGVSYTTGSTSYDGRHHWHARFFGGELNYKMPQVAEGFYVGASGGLTSASIEDAIFPDVDDLYLGPKAGIWKMISPDFSVGFEGKMLLVTSSPVIAWFDFLGSIRLHF